MFSIIYPRYALTAQYYKENIKLAFQSMHNKLNAVGVTFIQKRS